MRYLVISHNKDSFDSLNKERRLTIRNKMNAFMAKYRNLGKCLDAYYLGDMKGGASIWEVETSEEAVKFNLENPMLHFQDYEILPLIEWDIGNKLSTEIFKKSAKK